MSLRTGYPPPQIRHVPSFEDERFPEKQESRVQTALAIVDFGVGDRPSIFCMPSTQALCAKTINFYLPDADFFGTDHKRRIAENVNDIDKAGKRVAMQWNEVADYIVANRGVLTFDAAFLDYNGDYTASRRKEIILFARAMLRRRSVLAVTLQTPSKKADSVIETVHQDLRAVTKSAKLSYAKPYRTLYDMLHMIFLLDKGRKT